MWSSFVIACQVCFLAVVAGSAYDHSSRWNADENRLQIEPARVRPSNPKHALPAAESRHPSRGVQFIDNRIPEQSTLSEDHRSVKVYHHYHKKPHHRQHQTNRHPASNGRSSNEINYNVQNAQVAPRFNKGVVYHTTHQRSSVVVPYKGATVDVRPSTNFRKQYRGAITSRVIPAPAKPQRQRRRRPVKSFEALPQDEPYRKEDPCVRCPAERTLVAKKGKNQIYLEHPQLNACYGNPRLHEYQFETLYGPTPGDLVDQGTHVTVGRVTLNSETVQMCQLKINVIVRKCKPLRLPKNVGAVCPLGETWGGNCTFYCKDYQQNLIGSAITECGNDLKWTSESPRCAFGFSCLYPELPENGRLSCETPAPSENTNGINPPLDDDLEEGTICRVSCNDGHHIPRSRVKQSVTKCSAGRWNVTEPTSCHPIRRRKHTAGRRTSLE